MTLRLVVKATTVHFTAFESMMMQVQLCMQGTKYVSMRAHFRAPQGLFTVFILLSQASGATLLIGK